MSPNLTQVHNTNTHSTPHHPNLTTPDHGEMRKGKSEQESISKEKGEKQVGCKLQVVGTPIPQEEKWVCRMRPRLDSAVSFKLDPTGRWSLGHMTRPGRSIFETVSPLRTRSVSWPNEVTSSKLFIPSAEPLPCFPPWPVPLRCSGQCCGSRESPNT